MAKILIKTSLKRDLFFLLTVTTILFVNFASLAGQHAALSQPSVVQRHLDASTRSLVTFANDRSRSLGLLNVDYIRSHLLNEAPWAESHGADHNLYLGAGLLYYSLAYAFQCRTIVVLGSGGGFVPRLLRQAQRDVERSRVVKGGQRGSVDTFQLILIDAHLPSAGWGATFYAENDQTVMRREFADIRYIFETTDEAFHLLKAEGIEIDYLHVDADHSFKQSLKDFINYVSLLSPRGVVSFHDTCRNATRHCETGVPETLTEIQKNSNAYGLQFLDAHYLYRGIALAIQKDAPAIESPKADRYNFCRNNVKNLLKTSSGFDKNGQLSSLGDFYECDRHFNLTLLEKPCPPGFRRSLRQRDRCIRCIPGMNGENCTGFRYIERREVDLPYELHQDMVQRQRLIAAWLADYNVQHLLEMNSVPVSKSLYHPIQSAVAADPRVHTPLWTEEGEVPLLRWLPVRAKDVLRDGDYASTVELDQTDALVCVDCQRHLKTFQELETLLDEFPHLRVIVLECHIDSNLLTNATRVLANGTWKKQAEMVIGSPELERNFPSHRDIIRRMIFFTKSGHVQVIKVQ